MPLLRKTGVRSPWMPAPLQGALERVRPALVVAAIAPAVLLGGNAQFIGQAARPEDTQWPARPAVLVQQPVPIPGAFVWQPAPARAPNSDPLHAPLLVADPPDPTLAQPSALPIGRLSRPEDAQWPARPIAVQGVPVPVPGAQAIAIVPPRAANTDPLHPLMVQLDAPDPTLVQPSALAIGRLARDEDTSRPARPMLLAVGAQPVPTAQALPVGVVHDLPIVPPDRPSAPIVVSGAQPQPNGRAQSIGKVADGDRLPLGPAVVQTGALALPWGGATRTIAPHGPSVLLPDRLSPCLLISVAPPVPAAARVIVGWRALPSLAPTVPIALHGDTRAADLHGDSRTANLHGDTRARALHGGDHAT